MWVVKRRKHHDRVFKRFKTERDAQEYCDYLNSTKRYNPYYIEEQLAISETPVEKFARRLKES